MNDRSPDAPTDDFGGPVRPPVGPLVRPGDDAQTRALLEMLDLPGLGFKGTYDRLIKSGDARVALAGVRRSGASKSLEGRPIDQVAAERLETLDGLGIHLLAPWSRAYPSRLGDLHDPPSALFARGDLSLLTRPAVAIVGSRKASSYGRRCAARVAGAFASRGVVVISGLAMGIDGAAHRGALDVAGSTIAVLGNGADSFYPKSNARLGAQIAEQGLVISEYPPGMRPQPYHFPQRNRIIAALAHTVIVVEAASRSGALITVDHALDLGRDVWGVPGPIDHSTHAGVNAMLREGAGVLDDPEACASAFAERFGLGSSGPGLGAGRGSMEPRVARALEAIEGGASTTESLGVELQLGTAETLALLTELEIGGWVKQDVGLSFRKA